MMFASSCYKRKTCPDENGRGTFVGVGVLRVNEEKKGGEREKEGILGNLHRGRRPYSATPQKGLSDKPSERLTEKKERSLKPTLPNPKVSSGRKDDERRGLRFAHVLLQ
jgi:hypothetical protein